jgi:hypothetical protein
VYDDCGNDADDNGKRTDEPVIMTVMIDSNQGNITLSLNGLISRWCTPTKCTFISISSPF